VEPRRPCTIGQFWAVHRRADWGQLRVIERVTQNTYEIRTSAKTTFNRIGAQAAPATAAKR